MESRKCRGRSYCVILDVSRCRIPKCVASQVTDSSRPISPLMQPSTDRSFVCAVDFIWRSMLRERSKTTSQRASIRVSTSITGTMIPRQLTIRETGRGWYCGLWNRSDDRSGPRDNSSPHRIVPLLLEATQKYALGIGDVVREAPADFVGCCGVECFKSLCQMGVFLRGQLVCDFED